jgi:hypothetical protein
MLDVEKHIESFKELIFKRLETFEDKFENRLRYLEMCTSKSDENEDIEPQHVIKT